MAKLLPAASRVLVVAALVTSSTSILASLASPNLLLPYHKESSCFDFAILVLVFSAATLAATSRAESTQVGAEGVTNVLSAGGVATTVFAVTKAATLNWNAGTAAGHVVSVLLLVICPVSLGASALVARCQQTMVRQEIDALADKYAKLMDGKDPNAEDEEPPELPVWKVITTLKPYFWPHQTKGRVSVILTWIFVAGSKATSVVAPLFIARATNELTNHKIDECMHSALYYALLLLSSKILKECQGLVYLNVKQAAFTDLAQDTFKHGAPARTRRARHARAHFLKVKYIYWHATLIRCRLSLICPSHSLRSSPLPQCTSLASTGT